MNAVTDLTGAKFDRLVVISRAGSTARGGAMWMCLCLCGGTRVVTRCALTLGRTRSCGCFFRETRPKPTHGRTKTAEYKTWSNMKKRCNPKYSDHKDYPYYVGRGITVCDRWLNSFEDFYADMGDRPSPAHSIDRIDNDGNYEPGNCRWATNFEQVHNRRPRRTSP